MNRCEDVGPWAGRPRAEMMRSDEVEAMLHLHALGWGLKRIAREGTVHPRVCGGSHRPQEYRQVLFGSIPACAASRCGSPLRAVRRIGAAGSIPACAGKPGGRRLRSTARGVHPRVCGEAYFNRLDEDVARGPSPRVRGKPPPASSTTPRPRVHPRVCGGSLPLHRGDVR